MDAGLQPEIVAVVPFEHRLQEGAIGAEASPAPLVHLEIGRAFVIAGVEIRDLGDARGLRGVPDRVEDRPAHARMLDAPFPARLVQTARRRRHMVLVPEEIGQHIVPAPACQAALAPAVIVGGLAAHIDHGVDRRGAADDLAARIGQRPPAEPGLRLGLELPVGAGIADREEVADGDMEPDPVIHAAGFEHQDPVLRIGRQPVGDDATGRARPDDDIVEGPDQATLGGGGIRHGVPGADGPSGTVPTGKGQSGIALRAATGMRLDDVLHSPVCFLPDRAGQKSSAL